MYFLLKHKILFFSGTILKKVLKMRKLKNILKKLSYFINLNILKKYSPKIFYIETSLVCELKCPECATGSGLIKRKKGYMSIEKFKIIADKIRPYAENIGLIIWGEPMLNPDIIEIIQYASKFSKTVISTNCISLNYNLAEKLILSGINSIIVSVDATSQDVYEKYRRGGDLNKVLENLALLQKLNTENGNRVNINPQFIVFEHNQHQMKEFSKICKYLGLKPNFKAPYIRENSELKNSNIKKYIRKKYLNIKDVKRAMSKCTAVKNMMTILLDGSVVRCCYDCNEDIIFGNIFNDDVLSIWENEKYKELREKLLSNKGDPFCIKNCLMYSLTFIKNL